MTHLKLNHVYQHHRGELYKVIGSAVLLPHLQQIVVYQALYGLCIVYARPLSEFTDKFVYYGPAVKPLTKED